MPMPRPSAILRYAFWIVGGVALGLFLGRFGWRETWSVIERMNPDLLGAAVAVNLLSLLSKGTAWHLLLRQVAACRWRVTQEANLLGAAMNSVSVAVVGESFRVQDLAAREGISRTAVAASVARVRTLEALALACFMLLAPTLLRLPPLLHGLQIIGGVVLLAPVAAVWSGRRIQVLELLPARARAALAPFTATVSAGTFVSALLLAVLNWAALWATYQLTFSAIGIGVPLAASFTALLVTNLSGLFRLTPGNVGVTQAAMIAALLPFGVPPHEALAAGLALQAVQIPPVLVLGLLTVGGRQFAARCGAAN